MTIAPASFDPDAALARFRRANVEAGAIASFIGQVRPGDANDPTESLALEYYPGLAEREIENFAADALKRWPLKAIEIIHRVGAMAPGEPIVFVAAAADHRRAAFEAVDFLMDYLKSEAPFWKQEKRASGTRWIEPRSEDYADIARWRDGERERKI